MKRFGPRINALYFLQITTAIVAFLISLVAVLYLKKYILLMYIVVGVACSVAFVLDFILMPLYFSKTEYAFDKKSITKRGGLFYTKKQLMKLSSVQYYTVIKTPLSGMTSLNFVIIHALGGKIVLNFLSSRDIKEVDLILLEILKGKEVVP